MIINEFLYLSLRGFVHVEVWVILRRVQDSGWTLRTLQERFPGDLSKFFEVH